MIIYLYQTFYQQHLYIVILCCSVHVTFIACPSVLGEGSLVCGSSEDPSIFCFFLLLKVFFQPSLMLPSTFLFFFLRQHVNLTKAISPASESSVR